MDEKWISEDSTWMKNEPVRILHGWKMNQQVYYKDEKWFSKKTTWKKMNAVRILIDEKCVSKDSTWKKYESVRILHGRNMNQ